MSHLQDADSAVGSSQVLRAMPGERQAEPRRHAWRCSSRLACKVCAGCNAFVRDRKSCKRPHESGSQPGSSGRNGSGFRLLDDGALSQMSQKQHERAAIPIVSAQTCIQDLICHMACSSVHRFAHFCCICHCRPSSKQRVQVACSPIEQLALAWRQRLHCRLERHQFLEGEGRHSGQGSASRQGL